MPRRVTLETLKAAPENAFLYCRKCGGQYSANFNDYWFWYPEPEFKCCKVNNILCVRHTYLEEI